MRISRATSHVSRAFCPEPLLIISDPEWWTHTEIEPRVLKVVQVSEVKVVTVWLQASLSSVLCLCPSVSAPCLSLCSQLHHLSSLALPLLFFHFSFRYSLSSSLSPSLKWVPRYKRPKRNGSDDSTRPVFNTGTGSMFLNYQRPSVNICVSAAVQPCDKQFYRQGFTGSSIMDCLCLVFLSFFFKVTKIGAKFVSGGSPEFSHWLMIRQLFSIEMALRSGERKKTFKDKCRWTIDSPTTSNTKVFLFY